MGKISVVLVFYLLELHESESSLAPMKNLDVFKVLHKVTIYHKHVTKIVVIKNSININFKYCGKMGKVR